MKYLFALMLFVGQSGFAETCNFDSGLEAFEKSVTNSPWRVSNLKSGGHEANDKYYYFLSHTWETPGEGGPMEMVLFSIVDAKTCKVLERAGGSVALLK